MKKSFLIACGVMTLFSMLEPVGASNEDYAKRVRMIRDYNSKTREVAKIQEEMKKAPKGTDQKTRKAAEGDLEKVQSEQNELFNALALMKSKDGSEGQTPPKRKPKFGNKTANMNLNQDSGDVDDQEVSKAKRKSKESQNKNKMAATAQINLNDEESEDEDQWFNLSQDKAAYKVGLQNALNTEKVLLPGKKKVKQDDLYDDIIERFVSAQKAKYDLEKVTAQSQEQEKRLKEVTAAAHQATGQLSAFKALEESRMGVLQELIERFDLDVSEQGQADSITFGMQVLGAKVDQLQKGNKTLQRQIGRLEKEIEAQKELEKLAKEEKNKKKKQVSDSDTEDSYSESD